MINLKNLAKNTGLLLAGLLVALALLEVLLRVFPPFEMRFKPDRIVLPVNKRYVIDNRGKFTKLDPLTVHTKNYLGFRGEPPPPDLQDYLSIITIGGSTTECFYLSDGQTWPDILGRKLSRTFRQVWLNNAGLDGATTYRHLILLEDCLVPLKPKVVLFLVGINDVGQGDIAAREGRKAGLGHWLKSLSHQSEVYSLGQNLYHYYVAQSRGLHHTEIDYRAAGSLPRIAPEIARQTLEDYRDHSLPFYRRRLEKLARICREHGIVAVFLTQPTLYGPGIDPITGVDLEQIKLGPDLNGRLMFEIVELYNNATREVAREQGLLLIDLAREMPRNSAYYYDYLHYTEPGCEQVAAIVYQHLYPLLATRFRQFKRE
jgi:lysophospholipase L1-like esterase